MGGQEEDSNLRIYNHLSDISKTLEKIEDWMKKIANKLTGEG
ncbi:hypothetical protein ES703_120856 [subsurface metagenome]